MTSELTLPDARLSVIIGTYNRVDQLRRVVDSILAQTPLGCRIYITDAGSNDGTVEYLRSIHSAYVIPVLVGKRLGQARSVNDVLAIVNTPYVAWLSDDNEVVDRGLLKAIDMLDSDPRIGMVALKTKDVEGPFVDAPYIGGISDLGFLNVNQGVLRTDLFRQVGSFSERFRDYGIDPDLTAKVLLSGYDIVYTRDVAIHHYRNWTTDKKSPEWAKMMERQRISQELMRRKYADILRPGRLATWRWQIGRRVWAWLDKSGKVAGGKTWLGQNARDWRNVLECRFISLLDPVRSKGKPFHLRQYGYRPARPLPPDPVLEATDAPRVLPRARGVAPLMEPAHPAPPTPHAPKRLHLEHRPLAGDATFIQQFSLEILQREMSELQLPRQILEKAGFDLPLSWYSQWRHFHALMERFDLSSQVGLAGFIVHVALEMRRDMPELVTPEIAECLARPVKSKFSGDGPAPTRLMSLMRLADPERDRRKGFGLTTAIFTDWFVTRQVLANGFLDYLSPEHIEILSRTQTDEIAPITPLMKLLHERSAELQKAFNLAISSERMSFIRWFLDEGLNTFPHHPMLREKQAASLSESLEGWRQRA